MQAHAARGEERKPHGRKRTSGRRGGRALSARRRGTQSAARAAGKRAWAAEVTGTQPRKKDKQAWRPTNKGGKGGGIEPKRGRSDSREQARQAWDEHGGAGSDSGRVGEEQTEAGKRPAKEPRGAATTGLARAARRSHRTGPSASEREVRHWRTTPTSLGSESGREAGKGRGGAMRLPAGQKRQRIGRSGRREGTRTQGNGGNEASTRWDCASSREAGKDREQWAGSQGEAPKRG